MSRLETAIRAAGSPVRCDESGFSKEFTFNADFIGFDGHFPGQPILPAVVQLMTGSMTAVEASPVQLSPQGVSRAKFLKQIEPGDLLTVSGSFKDKGDNTLAAITIRHGDDIAATFTVSLIKGK